MRHGKVVGNAGARRIPLMGWRGGGAPAWRPGRGACRRATLAGAPGATRVLRLQEGEWGEHEQISTLSGGRPAPSTRPANLRYEPGPLNAPRLRDHRCGLAFVWRAKLVTR